MVIEFATTETVFVVKKHYKIILVLMMRSTLLQKLRHKKEDKWLEGITIQTGQCNGHALNLIEPWIFVVKTIRLAIFHIDFILNHSKIKKKLKVLGQTRLNSGRKKFLKDWIHLHAELEYINVRDCHQLIQMVLLILMLKFTYLVMLTKRC